VADVLKLLFHLPGARVSMRGKRIMGICAVTQIAVAGFFCGLFR